MKAKRKRLLGTRHGTKTVVMEGQKYIVVVCDCGRKYAMLRVSITRSAAEHSTCPDCGLKSSARFHPFKFTDEMAIEALKKLES